MGERQSVTNREVQAMIFNIKEQRMLEKTMQTLNLEQDYAMKLIGLGNRQVKIGHKRLKNKVSKIHSHLSAEEIADLRMAELEGTFRPTSTTMPAIGNVQIRAASKRLKVIPDGQPRRPGVPRATSCTFSMNSSDTDGEKPVKALSQTRIRSISASCIPTPMKSRPPSRSSTSLVNVSSPLPEQTSVNGVKEEKIEATSGRMTSRSRLRSRTLSRGSMSSQPVDRTNGCSNGQLNAILRPATSRSRGTLPSTSESRPKTAPGLTSSYSSHEVTNSDMKGSQSSIIQVIANQHAQHTGLTRSKSVERCISSLSDSSIGSNQAKEKAAERRQELIEEEMCQNRELENKRQDFMERISDWVRKNPSVVMKEKPRELKIDINKTKRRPMHKVGFDKKSLTEEERRNQSDKAWKELTKCRYLRISDDIMDLSGVNTLVKDQVLLSFGRKVKRQNSADVDMEMTDENDH